MSQYSKQSSGGVCFLGLLTILFIGLKLSGQIDWSWWWVLSPMWMPLTAALGIAIVFLAVTAAFGAFIRRL